jgi:lipopolysaccharide export system protein LptA
MSDRAANRILAVALAACALAALPPAAWARSTDRNQPMDIDAGSQSGSLDGNSVSVLSGGVSIRQGTLDIQSSRADIHQRGGDVVRAVLTGSPVVLKQQMDDGTPMTARASNVDYNLKTEIVVFSGNVSIEQPRGTMSGQRVVYNLRTGRVDSGGAGNGRVKMRIQPRASQGTSAQGKG